MRRALPVVAIAAVAILLLVVLSSSGARRSGSNDVPPVAAVELATGERACQVVEVPPGTAAVAAWSARAGSSPRIAVTVGGEGRSTAAATTSGETPDGRPLAELEPAPDEGPARLCMQNRSGERAALLGSPDGVVAVDFFSPRESWWGAAPVVSERFGVGKSGLLGSWAFWLALALVAAGWVVGWRAFAAAGART